MCLLFTKVISKSLENLAMFTWVKGGKQWQGLPEVEHHLEISVPAWMLSLKPVVTCLCSNSILLTSMKDLNWPGLSRAPAYGLRTYLTLLPLLSRVHPLLLQELSFYGPYVRYTHSHRRPTSMNDLQVGDSHAGESICEKIQSIARNGQAQE